MNDDTSFIRPSILPKLAHCGFYRSAEAGEAAERGTAIDAAFRKLLGAPDAAYLRPLEQDEARAADWAACTARALAGGKPLDATEAGCAITLDIGIGRELTGTADVVCRGGQWSGDLKSGQKRSYRAQQACYALGFMEQEFCDEWTVYLLYCDLETVETLRFTRESAMECIQDALALWRSKAPPQTNDYCGWCQNQFLCQARRDELGTWLSPLDLHRDPPTELAAVETGKLVSLVLAGRELESWTEEARRLIKERHDKGERFPGVKTVAKRGSRIVEVVALLEHVEPKTLALACKPLSEEKARGLWPELPDAAVTENPGRVELHVSKPKSKNANN